MKKGCFCYLKVYLQFLERLKNELLLLLLLLYKMVKKRGVSKKKKVSEKRTIPKSRKSELKKEEQGFFSKLFGDNSKKSVKRINTIKIKPSKNKKIVGKISEKKLGSQEKETKKKLSENFMRTGIKGFDALFEKNMGIPNGNSILIEGGPGSGKTIFCLATLNELCKQGKKCLYMSFEESEEQLVAHMEEFGWRPKEFIKKGLLKIERFDAIDISRSIEALLSAAKKELLIDVEPMFFPEDFDPNFVIIDSLTSIASAFTGEESRFRIYMEQLFRYLEKNNITNFLIREVSSPSHIGTTFKEQGEAVSFLSDGIVVLYNIIYDSGERASAIEILKMRGVSFKHKIVELKIINKKGIEVNPNKVLKKSSKSNFSLT
ncbi:RAD55 family ATPase [Candidatus Babeliales bacterium]|nr:RAD55 family ATPase [Candidatus Babeliales bacterium]